MTFNNPKTPSNIKPTEKATSNLKTVASILPWYRSCFIVITANAGSAIVVPKPIKNKK